MAGMLTIFLVFAIGGCHNPTQENGDPEDNKTWPIGDTTRPSVDIGNYHIYVGYEGNLNHGILKIDLRNFTVVDSVLVDGVPFNLTLSSDSTTLFVPHREAITTINLNDFTVASTFEVPADRLELSLDDRFIFAAYRNLFNVFDLFTEAVIYSTDSLRVRRMVADRNEPGVFAAFRHEDSTSGSHSIFHFNLESRGIDRIYTTDNTNLAGGISPYDMDMSNNGLALLFTSYNTYTHGTALRRLDLISGEFYEKANFTAGQSQLAISSDDRYVYITDPGIHMSIFEIPSGILRRYEFLSHTLTDYIDTKDLYISEFFGIWPDLDQIALFPDDKHCVISSWMDSADVMVFDLEDKQLLGTVALGRGKHTQIVRAIEIGPVPLSPQ
jgi:hypothetical protein